MIILNENDFIAKGSHRSIFKYTDPDKCLKVVTSKKKSHRWYKKFRPLSWYNENLKEIKTYKLFTKKPKEIFEFLPRFYGTIETNLGQAMIIEYINNSLTIYDFITKYGLNDDLKIEINRMFNIFYKNNIQIRDPNLNNYIIKIIDNKPKIKIIDGIGNSQLIPLADYIPFIGKKQIVRRIHKFFNNIYRHFPEYKNQLKFEIEK